MNILKLNEMNSSKNMEIDIHGLKCDNTECNWEDMTIPYEDYHKNVNAPCPICGENILTEDDYNETIRIKEATDILNKMTSEEIQDMISKLSTEQMDQALDWMNDSGLKKIGTNDDGTENWTTK